MRQVKRVAVGKPARLERITATEVEVVKLTGRARSDIYRHKDVVSRLRELYMDKCYLCERPIGEQGEVEHFRPWHAEKYPERAYEWDNLHWCCPECNSRKRQGRFTKPPNRSEGTAVDETLLIDPSDPPFGMLVEELIKFEDMMATGNSPPNDKDKVVERTVEFLNDKPLKERIRQSHVLFSTAMDAECVEEWRALSLEPDLDPTLWDASVRTARLKAMAMANGIYLLFLRDEAPYSTCMRAALSEVVRDLTVEDFARLSDAFRKYQAALRSSTP